MDQPEEEAKLCEALYKTWPRVYAFVVVAYKKKVNHEALLHTLKACLAKRPDNPWAYCSGTLKIVNGNFNEKEYVRDHANLDFREIVEKLKKL